MRFRVNLRFQIPPAYLVFNEGYFKNSQGKPWVSFVSPRPSMFPEAKLRRTLRFGGNKTRCFPRDQSLSVLLYLPSQNRKKKLRRNRLVCAYWLGFQEHELITCENNLNEGMVWKRRENWSRVRSTLWVEWRWRQTCQELSGTRASDLAFCPNYSSHNNRQSCLNSGNMWYNKKFARRSEVAVLLKIILFVQAKWSKSLLVYVAFIKLQTW